MNQFGNAATLNRMHVSVKARAEPSHRVHADSRLEFAPNL